MQRQVRRELLDPCPVAVVHDPVLLVQVRGKVPERDAVPVLERTAAHDVEQHVGEVVGRRGFVGGHLEPVGARDTAPNAQTVRLERRLERRHDPV